MRIAYLIYAPVLLLLLCASLFAQTPSEFIHLDQFGYLSVSKKVAVISNPQSGYNSGQSYTPGATMEVINMATGNAVFSGPVNSWNNGVTHDQSGDKGYWFDFSSIESLGTYYLSDPTTGQTSGPFEIKSVVYEPIMKAAGRMFYYNRCNMSKAVPYAESNWVDGDNFRNALQDANCRYIFDKGNASLEKDLTGGWFDAGDYNKYVTFATGAVANMLWAYEENPEAFGDNWNLPESGNGIPDLLDEVKYEMDWLYKMTNADGSVHIKMGSQNHSENIQAPPSLNTDPRFYGPTCTAASIATINMFAHAARVLKTIPAFSADAARFEARAIDCWNYVLPKITANQLEEGCDDGSIIAGDADWDAALQLKYALSGAVYLFALTGEVPYNNYVISNTPGMTQVANNEWNAYDMYLQDALLLYASQSGSDATVAASIRNGLSTAASNNWNNYFGFSDLDLYRAYMPDWSYHWGSNSPKASYANLNMLLNQYSLNTANSGDYQLKAAEVLHYFHGVNPQGIVYLSNMYSYGAERSANEIYHTWFADGSDWDHALNSAKGPAPGYVSGGPNASFTIGSISPPSGQPLQKSYLDFNDGWPNNSWEITEPAIYYQAAYIRLLANFTNPAMPTVVDSELGNGAITLYPNPTAGLLNLEGVLPGYQVQVLDIRGVILQEVRSDAERLQLDLSHFSAGTYLVRITDLANGQFVVRKVLR